MRITDCCCSRSGPFRKVALALILLLLPAFALAAPSIEPASAVHAADVVSLPEVPQVLAPSVDRAAVAVEDAERETVGLPFRFAITNEVSIRPADLGVWEEAPDGTLIWRLRVRSEGALSLNLGFTRFEMPEGGQLVFYAPDMSHTLGPYTAVDNAAHGELWTPVLLGDEMVIELNLPAGTRDELELHLGSVNVGYRVFGEPKDGGTDSGSCNVDVVCPDGDDWRNEIPAIARILIGGGSLCTGFMVNNVRQDLTPYFMTADHCGVSTSNASSLVVYWNFETSVCDGTPDGSLSTSQTGAFFRSDYGPSDMTLVELDSDPDPAWGITFVGWDNSGDDLSEAICIHHPSGDEKRISFEFQPTTTTSYLGDTSPGNGTHIRVEDWDIGTTEGGSSGSPLFDNQHRAVGQLHGGYAACSNDLEDWYGKVSVSWLGGGTSDSQLKFWLDPDNTGATTLDTLNPNNTCSSNAECDDGLFCNGAETCGGSGFCQNGSDPCPEACDETNDVCVPFACDDDGVCEVGEDCTNCPGDCIGGNAAVCGNNVCETGGGENCLNCAQDCHGRQNGKPGQRFCCGDGAGDRPLGCSAGVCNEDGFSCDPGAGEQYCCGNGTCSGNENSTNCEIDCGPPPGCGDGSCDPGEDTCSCPSDCGSPPASETGLCNDGVDDDCDGAVDCADADCVSDPACDSSCAQQGESCTVDDDCCTLKCKGPSGRKTCK